jgi:hypothetical protein
MLTKCSKMQDITAYSPPACACTMQGITTFSIRPPARTRQDITAFHPPSRDVSSSTRGRTSLHPALHLGRARTGPLTGHPGLSYQVDNGGANFVHSFITPEHETRPGTMIQIRSTAAPVPVDINGRYLALVPKPTVPLPSLTRTRSKPSTRHQHVRTSAHTLRRRASGHLRWLRL